MMSLPSTDWSFFSTALLRWYRPERRVMPWKEEKNPYYIWLSEIILQQTRVEQGLPYFERFKAAYPRLSDLAQADDEEVMKLWEGLGYYSRARNLLKAARLVHHDYQGQFPKTYEGLLQLPGVGSYTAAAIASFAFDLPQAVLDGNVYRVLARYTNDHSPIDTAAAKKHYASLASQALGAQAPARYNQAIMDFGAMVCSPQKPLCAQCPLASHCAALAAGTVAELPIKSKKLQKRKRYFHFLILRLPQGMTLIEKRGTSDIWGDLYQFPLLENEQALSDERSLLSAPQWPSWLPQQSIQLLRIATPRKQQLTHQEITAYFYEFEANTFPNLPKNTVLCHSNEVHTFAFPKIIRDYLDDKTLTLL